MRLLISPAKKMREEDFLAPEGEPLFLHRAGRLLEALRAMPYPELKKLLACNDAIAQVNYQRYQAMDLARAFTPALLAYEGIQYQYMAPGLFTQPQFDYVKEHLRILSGFYGLLRPLDPVAPYRLEMQVEKGVYVKMARGEMVRFLAERQARSPEAMQAFDRLGYRFSPEGSDEDTYVFLQEGKP